MTIDQRDDRKPDVFRREIRADVRYERGLIIKAILMLAVVAVILILRTL